MIPGLWDAHTHPWQSTYGGRQTALQLAYGITTAVSLGGFAYEQARIREAVAAGALAGPRLLTTGELLDGDRVAYSMARAHRTPEGLRRSLTRARALDWDFVKTYVRAPGWVMKEAADFAHDRLGVRSGSHLCSPGVQLGQDLTTHLQGTQRLEFGHATTATGRAHQDLEEICTRTDFHLIATPFTAVPLLGADPALADDPRVTALMPPWDTALVRQQAGLPPAEVQLATLDRELHIYRRILAAGGLVALGTDQPLVPVGLHLHLALRALHRAGLSPAEALRTATQLPARVFGADADLGTLEEGRLADLTIVDGDPFTDFATLIRTVAVRPARRRPLRAGGPGRHLRARLHPEPRSTGIVVRLGRGLAGGQPPDATGRLLRPRQRGLTAGGGISPGCVRDAPRCDVDLMSRIVICWPIPHIAHHASHITHRVGRIRGGSGRMTDPIRTDPTRIDVHQHLIPPECARAMAGRAAGLGWPAPVWDEASALSMMDRRSIATGVLSYAAPLAAPDNPDGARTGARSVNEYTAELVKNRPDRFGLFAVLPLPDVDGALAEAAHALDELNADGVMVLSNAQGRYLGDPEFEPLWAELDRRSAVVLVHPTAPPGSPGPPDPALPPAPLVDFPYDTTRTALHLVMRGVPRRHPRIRMILPHAGGFLPYAAHRLALAGHLDPDTSPEDFLTDLRRFYFDTALAGSPATLPSLLSFADPERILFGSDFPMLPEEWGTGFDNGLDGYAGWGPGQLHAVNRGNAEALIPRLATR